MTRRNVKNNYGKMKGKFTQQKVKEKSDQCLSRKRG